MSTYPIHEVFHTFQGEGVHMGYPAFFIRLYGCPIHCPWCDSAGTWHPEWTPKNIQRATSVELATLAANSKAPIVVITGGEPCIHDLTDLVDEIKRHRIQVHLETSGAFEIEAKLDWITLSPKKWRPPLTENLLKANEFKIIVEEPEDIFLYSTMINMRRFNYPHVWLHPEWSKAHDRSVLQAISTAVKGGNGHYRAGYQIQKLYMVDALDERSRPLVPLGGDPGRGM